MIRKVHLLTFKILTHQVSAQSQIGGLVFFEALILKVQTVKDNADHQVLTGFTGRGLW